MLQDIALRRVKLFYYLLAFSASLPATAFTPDGRDGGRRIVPVERQNPTLLEMHMFAF
jgi:hypothetical protein